MSEQTESVSDRYSSMDHSELVHVRATLQAMCHRYDARIDELHVLWAETLDQMTYVGDLLAERERDRLGI